MRKLIYEIIDKVNWYLFRRSCLSIYMSSCLHSDKIFPRALPSINDYVYRQQAEGGLGGYFTAMKLLELSNYLDKHKPTQVIEFGGGSTTAVFAKYASENPDVRFISVDESQYYQELTKERLLPEHRDYVSFVHANRIERTWRGSRVCHYDHTMFPKLGEGPWMCYVDGPDTKSSNKTKPFVKLPCVDVVILAEKGTLFSDIIFDCRFASVRFVMSSEEFYAHLPRLHFRAAQSIDDWALIDQNAYHSILSLVHPK